MRIGELVTRDRFVGDVAQEELGREDAVRNDGDQLEDDTAEHDVPTLRGVGALLRRC